MPEARPRPGERTSSGVRAAVCWTIPRSDLDTGGALLLRATHSLLPRFASAGPAPEGFVLAPRVAAPLPAATLDPGDAGPFLARLLSLASFLRWAGLGIAEGDLPRVGIRPNARARPWLGAPPVPLWRATPPLLVAAFVALRIAGRAEGARRAGSGAGGTLRDRLEEGAFRADRAGSADSASPLAFARRALRAEDEGESPESLVAGFVPEAAWGALGAELLGLVSPVPPEAREVAAGKPGASWGAAASWVLLGASRALTPPLPLADVSPGDPLEEGSGLRSLARGLSGDPRSPWIAALARAAKGAGRPPACPQGPPTAVTLTLGDGGGWDPRSRAALSGPLAEAGLRLFEERSGPPAPWEPRVPIRPLVDATAVAASIWLPWPSPVERLEACERLAREAAGDPARLLAAARAMARERPESGPRSGRPLAVAGGRRAGAARSGGERERDPLLCAASILAPRFTLEEAATAAGIGAAEAGAAIEGGVARGLLVETSAGRYSFALEDARALLSSSLSRGAARDAVERLEESGIDPSRLAVSGLSRGGEGDVGRAAAALEAALSRGGSRVREEADLLLSRAPPGSRDLARPALAALAHAAAGRHGEARESAARAATDELRALAPAGRRVVARLLARSGDVARALELAAVGTDAAGGALERVRLLLLARRDAEASGEAEELLGRRGAPGVLPPEREPEALFLAAEADGRLGRAGRAGERLDTARGLLAGPFAKRSGGAGGAGSGAGPEAEAEALSTAGLLASDLGRPREAAFFFGLAVDASAPEGRAAAETDLAVSLIHAGELPEAGRLLDSALRGFQAAGDEERWVSALANRADLRLLAGDVAGARGDVERVLAFDRREGRERQLLFALPTRQEIALLEGDLAGAGTLFAEARGLLSKFPRHDAARHLLVLEGRRLLMSGDPASAASLLAEAGRLGDNRMADEPLRARLLASAARDRDGRASCVREPGGGDDRLLAAEVRIAEGLDPGREFLGSLRDEASGARGAVGVAALVGEWWHRFPPFFAGPCAGPLLELGRSAASRCGAVRLAGLLEAALVVPPGLSGRSAVLPLVARPGGEHPDGDFVAEDESTCAALRVVKKVARTRLTVLVLGETGTGKEVVAREVHRLSGRHGPFVAINVAALPETLAESELFGHARGAFSGADRERAGLVETASGGTLFLDEVGELAPSLQAKLLRVLQEKEVRRLGESRERKVDLRVVAATHRDLPRLAREGRFREDLLWRLAGAEVRLLPLRERPRDLAALLARFLSGRGVLLPPARALLLAHGWPGNVRELVSAVESALAMTGPGGRIGAEHLPAALRPPDGKRPGAPGDGGGDGSDGRRGPDEGRERYRRAIEIARRSVIATALGESAGNRSKAAEWLGISRQSLLYEMRKLGVA